MGNLSVRVRRVRKMRNAELKVTGERRRDQVHPTLWKDTRSLCLTYIKTYKIFLWFWIVLMLTVKLEVSKHTTFFIALFEYQVSISPKLHSVQPRQPVPDPHIISPSHMKSYWFRFSQVQLCQVGWKRCPVSAPRVGEIFLRDLFPFPSTTYHCFFRRLTKHR